MKKLLLILATIPTLLSAQKTYEINFDDGSTKVVTMNYDDPDNLPKFNLTYDLFGFSVIGQGMLSYQLKPEFRINNKMMVSGKWSTAYSRSLDENIRYNSSYQSIFKKTSTLGLLFHYSLFTLDKPVTKKVAVDYGGNTVYLARLPRTIAKTLQVEVGIQRTMTPAELELLSDSSTAFSTFRAMNFSSFSGVAGISFYKHESYQVTSNGVSRSFFRYTRIYAHAVFAMKTAYTTYSIDYGSSSSSPTTAAEATSGFISPSLSKMGWNLGIEKHMGIKNSSASICIGFELGKLPHLISKDQQGETTTSPASYFQIHFGFGLGTKIKK